MKTGTSALALAAIALATTVACSSDDATKKDVTVTIVAYESFTPPEGIFDAFTNETGISVRVVAAGDAGEMIAKATLTAGNPEGDVMWGVDNTLLSRALDADVFDPYVSEVDGLDPDLVATAADVVTPVDYGDVCVNIDDAYFADAGIPAPKTLSDLIDPMYRDLLVVQDPASSSPGLAFLLATVAEFDDGWTQYWAALRDNGVKVAGSWTDAYVGTYTQGGGDGDRPLVVSYATSPPAEIVYAAEPQPKRPSSSVMTNGCYRQVEYAGILAGTQQQAAAQRVVDWLISAPVQADVPLSMFVFPARANVPLPEVFDAFAARVPEPLQLDAGDVSTNLTMWLEAWGDVMGR